MSGSGKCLLGLWLYHSEGAWTLREGLETNNIDQTEPADIKQHNFIVFSIQNKAGNLAKILRLFEDKGINVVHIESRESRHSASEYEILLDVECDNDTMNILTTILEKEIKNGTSVKNLSLNSNCEAMPWFPRKISDLDKCSNHVLMYGSDLDADHPGFKDEKYRKRRKYFAELAFSYKYGQPIPRPKYTDAEIKTWSVVLRELLRLYPTHACQEYMESWPELVKYCGYRFVMETKVFVYNHSVDRENNIPQLADISEYLKYKTGFTLRPVAGYLSPRDFLSGLAFRVFYCTQYIRHPSNPLYTPEPDCCHELLGHVPMLACPSFAQFSQEIGLASLGTSDEMVNKLATLYFFSVEFGLCKQNGKLKVYGAGLLSSIAELRHALSDKAVVKPFDIDTVLKEECLITTFQNCYFYTDSFENAKDELRKFATGIARPFMVRYNPYTLSVEILSRPESLEGLLNDLKGDLFIVRNALKKMKVQDENGHIENFKSMLLRLIKEKSIDEQDIDKILMEIKES